MSDVTPVARVAISSAVLFIPADGVDRDPDFSNPADLAAVKRLSAAEYIKDRKEYKASPHRLYCPCCFDKGHLSRHYGVRNHEPAHICCYFAD